MSKNNNDDFPLTDFDDGGVIYNPSDNAKKVISDKNPKKVKPKTPIKVKSSNMSKITVYLIFSCIIISAIIFFIVYNTIGSNYPKKQILNQEENALELSQNLASQNSLKNELDKNIIFDEVTNTRLGFINEINTDKNQISFISIEDNKDFNLKYNGNTELKDKFNQSLSFSEFSIGDVVNFTFTTGNSTLKSIRKSGDAFEHKNINNFKFNTELKNINFDEYYYLLSPFIKIIKNNETITLNNISQLDTITVKGCGNTIYSIKIEKGTGKIQLKNKNALPEGIIEIDDTIYKKISETNTIEVGEGSHKIIIRGDNLSTFVQDIYVSNGEIFELDLSNVEIKTGVLLINTNVTDYFLYVNNEIELSREPLVLPYGSYTIKIIKPGYNNYEAQITINKGQTPLNITLNPISINSNTDDTTIPKEIGTGKLTVNSTPEGAKVYIDNKFIGETPISHKDNIGTYKVTIKKDGFKEIILNNINIEEKTNELNITLQEVDTSTKNPTIN